MSWIDTMGIALRHQLTSLDKKIIRNANRTERRKLLCYERKPLAIKALKWPEANSLLTAQIRNVKQINGTGKAWKKIIETLRLVDELIIYNRNVSTSRSYWWYHRLSLFRKQPATSHDFNQLKLSAHLKRSTSFRPVPEKLQGCLLGSDSPIPKLSSCSFEFGSLSGLPHCDVKWKFYWWLLCHEKFS